MPSETIPNGLHTTDGRQPRVAIVDGNTASATVTAILVEQFGCAALKAPGGEAALAMLRRGEAIDLVLIDLGITDMDGVVAVLLMRAMGGKGAMPIVPLASTREQVMSPRSRAAGLSRALMKPFSPRELFAAMQTALARTPEAVLHDA